MGVRINHRSMVSDCRELQREEVPGNLKVPAWSQEWEGTGRRAVCDSHQLVGHMYTLHFYNL